MWSELARGHKERAIEAYMRHKKNHDEQEAICIDVGGAECRAGVHTSSELSVNKFETFSSYLGLKKTFYCVGDNAKPTSVLVVCP